MARTQEQRIEQYQNTPLLGRDAEHLIIEFLRSQIITTTQIERVVNAWDTDETYDNTVWKLFNNVTEQMKGRGQLARLPRTTQALHGLMDSFVGFHVDSTKERVGEIEDVEILEAA
jgi:hypothetical protein